MIKNQSILVVSNKKLISRIFIFQILSFVLFLAQGPLMITGPGMGMYPQGNFGAGGIYPSYGGATGYSGY